MTSTPDPSHADAVVPVEPIEWTLARIEAMASVLYDGTVPECKVGQCTPEPVGIVEMRGELPLVRGYRHASWCDLYVPLSD